MIKSCVTISLVPSLRGGPWIFWDDLETSLTKAKVLGFDAVELFSASADAVDPNQLSEMLSDNDIALSAVGSGAGRAVHKLFLTNPDQNIRSQARKFIIDMIKFAGPLGAPVIIGSMQGELIKGIDKDLTFAWLAESLEDLAEQAAKYNVPLIYEPLNRYETNLVNRLEDGVDFIKSLNTDNVKLLADLFHMNIEEASIPDALRTAKDYIGHVHFADSNRRPVGFGHTAMEQIAKTLQDIGYDGYVSAEAFAYPDPDKAAAQTIKAFKKYFK
jgi:sugar phosphate isomerase/epimerase